MAPVKLGILGPLEARVGAQDLPIDGPKRRALLAMLLLHANREISVGRIIDALWGGEPPVTSRAQVQSLVHALRRSLALAQPNGPTIKTRPEGYVLLVPADQVDLVAFEQTVATAREAAALGRLKQAADAFQAAAALWRGPALDGVEAPFVAAEAARLEEKRLLAEEERIEVELELGRHAALVGHLAALVAEHPLRERLRAALMLALYRSGRRADALEVYRSGRETMVEELGLDPGPELRELERAILKGESSLDLIAKAPLPPIEPPAENGARPAASGRFGRRGRLVAAGLAAAMAMALVWDASDATRMAGETPAACRMQSHVVTDYRSRPFDRIYHCSTFVGVDLYANPQDRAPLQDVTFMNASADNWVVCQMRGRPNPVIRGRTNSWWLYTQGDTDNRPNDYGYTHAWAFMPATVVDQAGRDLPVSGVPACAADYAVPGMPAVSSPNYPADGRSHGRPGETGTFEITPATGTSDLDGFVYGVDSDAPDTFLAAAGVMSIHLALPSAGPHTLSVRAKDHAGNLSPPRTYAFIVGG